VVTFRILHVSDLHLAQVGESINWIDLRPRRKAAVSAFRHAREGHRIHLRRPTSHDIAALQDLAEHAFSDPELDLILITGDIATTGEPDDLQAAFDFIAKPAAAGWKTSDDAPTLAAAETPIAILPGNHDRYENTRFPFGAAAVVFDDVFNEYWWAGQNASPLAILQKGNEWLLLIGADFSLRVPEYRNNPFAHAGQGDVSRHVLKSLRLLTRRYRDQLLRRGAAASVAWAIHFAPRCPDPLLALRNDESLITAAEEDGVHHIFCGHTHQADEPPPIGNVHIHCAGTGSSFDSPHGNFIHTREIDVVSGTITDIRSTDHRLGVT
jgi:hypothetical protein